MRFKKTIIIFVILAVAGAVIVYFTLGKKEQVEYVTAKVERGDIIQTVSETGTVKASSEIDLNFLNSGKIAKILVKIGDKVKKDQILAELDYSDLSIKVKEAQANLEVAKANLAKLLAGATAEEIAVSQAGVSQAKTAYNAARRELEKVKNTVAENIAQAETTLSDLESKTDGDITAYEQAVTVAQISLNNTKSTYQRAIDNKETIALTTIEDKLTVADTALDTINTVITDDDAKDVLSVKKISYLDDTKNNHSQTVELLTTANSSLAVAKQNKNDVKLGFKTQLNIIFINQAIDDALAVLNKTFIALNNCYDALENSVTSADFTQTELDSFKINVSADLTLISTAISAAQTAQQNLADAVLNYDTNVSNAEENLANKQAALDDAIITAKNALASARLSGEQQTTAAQTKVNTTLEAWQVAKAQLAQVKAPANAQDIALQQAKIKQAQAALDSVKNQVDNSIIKAPINGTITKVEYEIGEQTQAGTPVISMLAENNYEIEVLISEADIAKVKLNDPTEITLDAFGEDVKFAGKIFFIEPAETEIQDVIYYKVIVEFSPSPSPSPARASRERGAIEMSLKGVKSGMTANVVITTAEKKNVLIMPSRAVIEKNGGDKIVRVLVNGLINEALVKLGLRGDEGMVEVLSGVKEGDEVVTFIKEKK